MIVSGFDNAATQGAKPDKKILHHIFETPYDTIEKLKNYL